jgi:tetratricopeptide (TPR) repeat protein
MGCNTNHAQSGAAGLLIVLSTNDISAWAAVFREEMLSNHCNRNTYQAHVAPGGKRKQKWKNLMSLGPHLLAGARLFLALSLIGILSVGCAKEEETKEARLERANQAFAALAYDKAEKEYRDVLRLDGNDPVAQRQLALLYFEQGQLLQSYPLLKKVAEAEPDNSDIQIKLGRALIFARESAPSRELALQVLEKHPGHEQALLLLADTALTPQEIEETQKQIEQLRAKDQDRAGYHIATGALYLRQNALPEAEREFTAAANLDAKLSDAHAGLGTVYWKQNDLKRADEELKASADLAPKNLSARLRYADFKLRTGATAEAKQILEEISQKTPSYLPARVGLMKFACAERQTEDCTARAQSILAQDSTNYDALYQDGLANVAKGDAAKAIREFEYLSNTYNQNFQVRYQLAIAYLLYAKTASEVNSRNAVEAAENSLTTAIKINPQFDPAILLLAELKLRKGNPAAAADLLLPVTQNRPQNAQAHNLLAAAYLAQQRTDQALAVYRQMTELFPQDPQPFFLTGSILLAQRKQSDARAAFEKALAISPGYMPAVEKLVDLNLVESKFDAALDLVQKQIDQNPKLAQAWAVRGKIKLAQRDFAQAEADVLKAIELDPKLEPAYLLLGQLYVASNRPEQAIEKLKAFTEKNQDIPTLMQLGLIQQSLKRFPEAAETYEKLLKINPKFAPALNNLAELYAEQLGKLDAAYDLAKKAREAAPNEPHMADTLGWILYKRGEYSNALRLLQESTARLPDNPEIHFHLGMAAYMVGDEEAARTALQKAASAAADFPGKEDARRRLNILAIDTAAADSSSRTQLEGYLRDQPNDPVALFRLAAIQQRDGATDQSVKTYEKIVDVDPLFAPAIRRLALLYGQRATDDAKSYELLTKARQAYPGDPEVAKALGIINYRRGLYPQSAELLKEASAKLKDDPELLFYIGEVQHQLKQWSECKETLQRALDLKLPPGLAEEARRALADCSETAPL